VNEGQPSSAAQGILVGAMWAYAASVLYPAQALRRALGVSAAIDIQPPRIDDSHGLGVHFSRGQPAPVLIAPATDGAADNLVVAFDRMAEVYAEFVRPFSRPIFAEALTIIERFLPPDGRALDLGCGPGTELRQVAQLVPRGEVVGIDLAAGMVEAADRAARAAGLRNVAFIQADIGALPGDFTGAFDLAYSCLAHHHYPEPARAASEVFRCVRSGGVYCVVDAGPAWYTALSAPLAKAADPGWIGFSTPAEFERLFRDAGFERVTWCDILPGFGVAIAQRA
jgi:SAM-dependent methyltransferase